MLRQKPNLQAPWLGITALSVAVAMLQAAGPYRRALRDPFDPRNDIRTRH